VPSKTSSSRYAIVFRLVLPALLAVVLIGVASWLYLAKAPPSPGPGTAAPVSPRGEQSVAARAEEGASAVEDAAAKAIPPPPRPVDALPTDSEKAYVDWMLKYSDESRQFLEKKWARSRAILARKDIADGAVLRSFLFTPRERFVRKFNLRKAYDDTAIPIGYGQTISGPHMVSHMTQSIAPERGDRVLEVGTGSGYQSAVLSELSDHVFTIEIIPALFRETDLLYRKLAKSYPEYGSIARKNADGYFGWPQHAPFQKIIVTAGIDHIPPPLLRQLAPGGIMVIPVGPPSGQTVLRVVKRPAPGGGFTFERSDIYRGRKVIFVPFTSGSGSRHSLDDSGGGKGR
jgi:protein-L-isoaspartate(D-aspartate) O-methyltransferase